MKLISMTNFVLGTESNLDTHNPIGMVDDIQKRYVSIIKYANFLKQPLTLGMFVPCDVDGNVLEKPESYGLPVDIHNQGCHITEEHDIYHGAKERILFEGFDLSKGNLIKHNWCKIFFLKHKNGYTYFELTDFTKEELTEREVKTIEDLTIVFNLVLTPQAIKQIGL